MKILFLVSDLSQFGGIQKYNRDFLSALSKLDVNPVRSSHGALNHVFAKIKPHSSPPQPQAAGHSASNGVKTILIERQKGCFIAKIFFFFRFITRFFQERPDVIFCSHLNFSPMCLIVKNIFKTPYVLTLYGVEAFKIKGRLKRRGVREAERIITISEYIKGFILKQFPEVEDNIFMLPSAVDGSLFFIKKKKRELVEKLRITDKKIILTLARLLSIKDKGQDRVLKALPYVLKKVPDATYLIVGGGEDKRVNAFLKEHPELEKYVIFTGSVPDEDRVDYYNLGDVFILPSKFEGFGIVFIESLACGVPVIASDDYGCREGLLSGELGLLVPPDDIRAIADTIITILNKQAPPMLFNRERLRARTLEIYGIDTWNARVKQLVDIFSS